MVYTDSEQVREEAGLVNNQNIGEGKIEMLIDEAHSVIRGMIGARYSLAAMGNNFSGSDAEKMLRRIETLLAAGYILQREYPQEEEENGEGGMRVDRATVMLDQIVDGSLKLYDSLEMEYTIAGSSKSGQSVNSTIPDWTDETSPGLFTVRDRNEF